jgi:hypothetical protein
MGENVVSRNRLVREIIGITGQRVRALPLDGPHGDVIYVTGTDTPEIAKITQTGSSIFNGSFTFNAGAPVTLTAPPASDTVTASSLDL